MDIYKADRLESLKDFAESTSQLGIVERNPPFDAEIFFKNLMTRPFEIVGKIRKEYALLDIKDLMKNIISDNLKADALYKNWISDMAEVCKIFCDLEKIDAVSFWLGTKRGCRRYHIDNVPKRLLVTYAGKGTEWIPNDAADRIAFESGEPNDKIIKDRSSLRHIGQWDVAVFRGMPHGILHRTPDDALNGQSILMRLDHPSFLKNIKNEEVGVNN